MELRRGMLGSKRPLQLARVAFTISALVSTASGFQFPATRATGIRPLFSTSSTVSTSPPPSAQATGSVEVIKRKIFQLAALTDRGKLQDPLVSEEGLYNVEKTRIMSLLGELEAAGGVVSAGKVTEGALDGEWELVWSSAQLFRSSPFFLAIEAAYNDSAKAELFFKLHELQTSSWGVSQVGRVAQIISMQNATLESQFDTVLLPLTTIPLVGFWKLLPTFGGRIISVASELKVREEAGGEVWLDMVLEKTSFKRVDGLGMMPGVGPMLEGRDFPTRSVWTLLPWNKGRPPQCSLRVCYVDEDVRVMRDQNGAVMVYARAL